MSKKVEDYEELKTIQDHIELLASLLECAQELPQSSGEDGDLGKEFAKMIDGVTKSMRLKCDYIIKKSVKYHKKPKLHKRLKDSWEEWKGKRQKKKLDNAQYKAYLEWVKQQKEQKREAQTEPPETPEGDQGNLPVCQPKTSTEVVEWTDGTEGRQEE